MLRLIHSAPKPEPPAKTPAATDEAALLQAICGGDTGAFEQFYKAYYPRLFRFILRVTRHPEGVEELIQETLLVVWEKPEQYNHDSKISTWVFGIAYHKALKAMSKMKRHCHDQDIDDMAETLCDPLANPAQLQEHRDWLRQALAVLPPEQRTVLELTFYHGMAYQEIAQIMDCPENTVKTRMFHARKKLQLFADSQES